MLSIILYTAKECMIWIEIVETFLLFWTVSTTTSDLTGDCGIGVLCQVVQRYVSDRLQLSLLLLILTMFIDELQNTVSFSLFYFIHLFVCVATTVSVRSNDNESVPLGLV